MNSVRSKLIVNGATLIMNHAAIITRYQSSSVLLAYKVGEVITSGTCNHKNLCSILTCSSSPFCSYLIV